MQELSIPSQSASPYTPVGGSNMPTAPNLGTPVPGTTGGLPALSGLSVFNNPLPQSLQNNDPQQAAKQTQSYGRGQDTMLVHMTPDEVNSLRGLAQQFGGDLTVNPHTGMPEAGWLGKLLPTILGIAGAAFGIPTWAIGLGVGAGQTAITGDLGKGLTAGLQAFGGAGLGQAVGIGGKLGSIGADIGLTQSATGASGALGNLTAKAAADQAAVKAGTLAAEKATSAGLLGKFGAETSLGATGLLGKALPMIAGSSVLGGISDATAPELRKYNPDEEEGSKWDYRGPYMPQPKVMRPTLTGPEGRGEINFFENANPYPGYLPAPGYAEGGEAKKEERPSWMPEWMQGYKGRYEITGEITTDNGRRMPTAKDTRTAEQMAALDADYKILRDYHAIIDKHKDTGFGSMSAEENELLNKMRPAYNDAARRTEYINKKDAEQTEATRNKYGYATYSMSQGTGPEAPPTGGLGATAPAQTATPPATTPPVITPPTSNIDMGGVTPGGGGGVTLGDRVLSPGATQSGAGLEILKDTYKPKFSQLPDYTSPYNAPLTMGSQMAAQLPALTSRYSTSPGAVTASRGYVGGSPSERIRAAAAANTAAAAPKAPATPTTGGELNFGFETPAAPGTTGATDTTNPYLNLGFTNPYFERFWNNFSTQGGYRDFQNTPNAHEFARGGEVDMRDGSFVVDARTVSELGNGSSNAGMELLQRLGGMPLKGPGDGVSDSIPARIGGKQEARVARDEVIMPPEAVRRIGGGSEKRGTQKLYALMDKAHKARKKAKRGQDTGLRRGLA